MFCKEKVVKGIIVTGTVIMFLAAVFILNDFKKEPLTSNEGQSYEKAVVEQVIKDNLQEDGNRYGEQKVLIKLKSGSMKGKKVEAISPNGTLFGADCVVGMNVIAMVSVSNDSIVATIYSQDRTIPMLMFTGIFIAVICIIGGKKGIRAVLSLAFTIIAIFYILFPCIYRGISPILATIVISAIITLVTILCVGGINKKSISAIMGTVMGVALAGIFAILFGKAAGITGYNVSDIESLSYITDYCDVKIGELLFAGIIVSALGAVMDVGMSISSAMAELSEKNKEITRMDLFFSGIHIGRDMMGTMSNTLILAFVGSSITTLMLDYVYDLSMNQLMNSYGIGIEIMQGLAGSIGIVLTVPVTAFISALSLKKHV